jgi:hypothetical protein
MYKNFPKFRSAIFALLVLCTNVSLAQPVISSFSPASTQVGYSLNISGSGFNNSSYNVVYLGAVKAVVTANSPTLLNVTVPAGANYAPITVLNTVTGLAATSSNNYIPSFSPAKTAITTADFASKVDFGTSSGPCSIAVGDMDGDRKPDVVTANYLSDNVSILRNTASSGSIAAASFATKVDVTTGVLPIVVTLADMDNDGKLDIVTANLTSNTVSVIKNNSTIGNLSFATKVDYATGSAPRSVTVGDIDGDGKRDIAVANSGSGTLSILRNTFTTVGTISFAAKVDFTAGNAAYSVAIGNIDGDSKLDVLVNNYNDNSVSIFRNTSTSGTISFATKIDFATGLNPQAVTTGDIDNDGKQDVLVTNVSGNTLSIFRNTSSSGSISMATRQDFTTGTQPTMVALGDADADGKADVSVSNYGSNSVSVFRNTSTSGSISLATKIDFATDVNPQGTIVADIDRDNRPDVLTANAGSSDISVIKNRSNVSSLSAFYTNQGNVSPTFTSANTSYTFQVANAVSSITFTASVTDANATIQMRINGGSYVTVASGSASPNLSLNVGSNTVNILVTAEDGVSTTTYTTVVTRLDLPPTITSFTPTFAKPDDAVTITDTRFNTTAANNVVFFGGVQATVTAASATSLTVTVPNGAAHAPITVLNTTWGFIGASVSNFNPVYSPSKSFTTTNDFSTKVDYTVGSVPTAIVTADVDGDGKADVVVSNLSGYTISVFRNTSTNGSISFATKVDYSLGASPNALAVGDIDRDGKPEIVLVTNNNRVQIFRNTCTIGTINFDTAVTFTTSSLLTGVAIADIDRDGLNDVLTTNFLANSFSVLSNNSTIGTISLNGTSTFSTGSGPTGIVVVDVDGDGINDVAVANASSNTLSVFRNTSTIGNVTFDTKVDFATHGSPNGIAYADVDGDGKIDIAVASTGSNAVSVFRNTASSGSITSSSLASRMNFAVGSSGCQLPAFSDINGDGKPDLVVVVGGNSTITFLRNTATSGTIDANSFTTYIPFTTGNYTRAVTVTDLDGDGKPDLLSANDNSGTMSVLRNADVSVWNGTAWSYGSNSTSIDAIITSNTASSNFTSRNLIINSGVALTTTGITATVNGNIVNNGNGIAGTGSLTINANSTISGNAINFNGTLTVNSGATLTTADLLTLTSTATNTARVAASAGTISGNVIVQRYIPGGRRVFRFLAHPIAANLPMSSLTDNIDITGPGGSPFTSTTTNSPSAFFYYNVIANSSLSADPGWFALVPGSTFDAFRGYRVLIRGSKGQAGSLTGGTYTPNAVTLDWSGPLNQGDVAIDLTNNGVNRDYNLIGNPYASSVDLSLVTRGSSVNANFSVWDASAGTRGAYVTQPFSTSYLLPSCAAFFVRTTGAGVAANNRITFTEASKSGGTTTSIFRTLNTDEQLVLQVNTNTGNYLDQLMFMFNNKNYTANEDATWDALKMTNPDLNLYSFSTDGKRLAIDRRPLLSDTIPLGFTSSSNGSFEIEVKELPTNKQFSYYLKDNYIGTFMLLTNGLKIPVTINSDSASQGNGRFQLLTKQQSIAPTVTTFTTTISPNPVKEVLMIRYTGLDEKETSIITITSANGKQVQTINLGKVKDGKQNIDVRKFASGTYVVQLTNGEKTKTEKVIKY